MQPTSGLFLGLVIGLTSLVFLATVLVVPRFFSSRGVLKYLVQTVSVLLTSFLILLAVITVLNAENLWYTSWGALTSSGENQQTQQKVYGNTELASYAFDSAGVQTATATALQASPATNPTFGAQLPADTSQGAYVTFTVSGEKSGETHDVLMWLPPSYFENTDRFYPVIMGFTGFPGSVTTYSKDLDFGQLILDQVQNAKMQEAILLIPDVMPGNNDTECVDGSQGDNPPKTETYISEDFVPWAKENLRTIDDAEAWATTGYSAGGWCSSMIAIRHPNLFAASLNQSGYFSPIYSDGQQWNDPNDSRYVLSDRVAADKPHLDIFFYASEDDSLAMDTLPAFADKVSSPTTLVVETVPTGGHRLEVWKPGIVLGLEHLGQSLKYFAPVKVS